MNAIRLPSGDGRGVLSLLSAAINAFGADEPSEATVQMSALRAPLLRSVVVRTNRTDFPSAESCGSETRTAASRSSIVIARPLWARAGACAANTAAASAAAESRGSHEVITMSPRKQWTRVRRAGPRNRHEQRQQGEREEDGRRAMLAERIRCLSRP